MFMELVESNTLSVADVIMRHMYCSQCLGHDLIVGILSIVIMKN